MKVTFNTLYDYKKSLLAPKNETEQNTQVSGLDTLAKKIETEKLNETLKAYNVGIVHQSYPATVTSKDLFNLLNAQVMNITESDVKEMFSGIKKLLEVKGIKAEDSEIKYAMKLLTQYANLSAFKKVDKQLPKECYEKYFISDGCGLSEFMFILDQRKHTFGENDAIVDKNKQYVFADDFSLEQYKEGSYRSINNYKPYVVALTGFDEGINYFNHTSDYSQFIQNTATIIKEAKKAQGKSDFKTALTTNLNEKARKNAQNHGLQIDFFINPDDGKDADFSDILNNLNFNIPSEKEIDALISSLAEFIEENTKFLGFKKNILKSALTKWYYNQLQIYSPKRINEGMKSIFNNLQRSEGRYIDKKDLSLVIPARQKSYTYMTRQFAQANGISPKQVMTTSQYYEKTHPQHKLGSNIYEPVPEKSMAIIVDDIAATGTSVISSCLGDVEYLSGYKGYYAPLTCTPRAITRINSAIADKGYKKQSKLVITDIISEDTDFTSANYTKKEAEMLERLFDNTPHAIGRKGFSKSNTAVIFPVMTPDNNNTLVTLFADRILLNPSASKSVYDRYAREVIEDKFIEKMNLY